LATKPIPASLRLASTVVNAGLYALIGLLWTVFPVTVFGVRFWPQVFVPAAFSVLFGPWTGGVGAAIGIFIADVFYGHHDPLLSLIVGVPSNFVMFFLIGWLTHRNPSPAVKRILLGFSLLVPIALAAYGVYLLSGTGGFGSPQVLVSFVGLLAVIVILGFTIKRNRWADFEVASSIGLGTGSIIIGVGIVGYSTIFTLPAVLGLGNGALPTTFMYATTAWTYLSEIPFLILLTPPVVAACKAAFPSLQYHQSSSRAKS